MSTMLYAFGRWVTRFRWVVLAAWVVLLALVCTGAVLMSKGTSNTFSISGTESEAAMNQLAATFPQTAGASAQLVVQSAPGSDISDTSYSDPIGRAVVALQNDPGVASVTSPYADNAAAVSSDKRAVIITIQLSKSQLSVTPETRQALQTTAASLARSLPAGARSALGGALFSGSFPSENAVDAIGLLVAIIVLLITFGSFAAAGMPLLSAIFGVVASVGGIYAATFFISISSTTPMLAMMLGLAVGIDYALFIISRHLEQRRQGVLTRESVPRAVATSGSAVIFAGLTVIIALCGLSVANIPFLSVMGLAAAIGVAVAVLASLTLIPALLTIAGDRLGHSRRRTAIRRVRKPARGSETVTIDEFFGNPGLVGSTDAFESADKERAARYSTAAESVEAVRIATGATGGKHLEPVRGAGSNNQPESPRIIGYVGTIGYVGLVETQASPGGKPGQARLTTPTPQTGHVPQIQHGSPAGHGSPTGVGSPAGRGSPAGVGSPAGLGSDAGSGSPADQASPAQQAPHAGQAGYDAQAQQTQVPQAPPIMPNPRQASSRTDRFFLGWVSAVTKWPVLTIVVVVLGLGSFALPALHLQLDLSNAEQLPANNPARQAYEMVADHFGAGYNGPLMVTGTIAASNNPVGLMNDIAGELRKLPDVASVPLATPNEQGTTGVIQVIPKSGPSTPSTAKLVTTIRDMRGHFADKYGVTLSVTGFTAIGIDVSARLGGALLPFGILVIGLSLILLAMASRSVAIPIKATIGYLFSVITALGVVELVFGQGVLAGLLGVDYSGPVISFLPIILLAVLFGLAMDYEVFLVSRMREEYVRHGEAREAVTRGFTSSAKVVTAAAIIMFSVFAAFFPTGDSTIKPMALGLAVGVFTDAFIVRMTFVPAVLRLLGRSAWWLPRWLDRVLPHFDVEGAGVEHELALASWPEPGSTAVVAASGVGIDGVLADVELACEPGDIITPKVQDFRAARALALIVSGRAIPERGQLKILNLAMPQHAGAVRRRSVYLSLHNPDGGLESRGARTARRARAEQAEQFACLHHRGIELVAINGLDRWIDADDTVGAVRIQALRRELAAVANRAHRKKKTLTIIAPTCRPGFDALFALIGGGDFSAHPALSAPAEPSVSSPPSSHPPTSHPPTSSSSASSSRGFLA